MLLEVVRCVNCGKFVRLGFAAGSEKTFLPPSPKGSWKGEFEGQSTEQRQPLCRGQEKLRPEWENPGQDP